MLKALGLSQACLLHLPTMLINAPIIVSLIVAIVGPVSCEPVYETNASRMARGLPPSPPRFGRTVPGAREPTVAYGEP